MWEFQAGKTTRLDRLLRDCLFPGSEWLSRQSWDWLLDHGYVTVNGRRERKGGLEVKEGSALGITTPGRLGLWPAEREASLLWGSPEKDLGIFEKRSGVGTLPLLPWDHSSFASEVASFSERQGWLSAPAFMALAAPPLLEGGVLQRLDRDTSGIVCVAFTEEVKALFRQLFSRSAFEKSYLALVPPEAASLAGERHVWLETGGGEKVRAWAAKPKGPAEEAKLVVEVCESSGYGALVRVRTRAGLRHVVRAGLAVLGAPLVGDRLYGGSPAAPFHQLHASGIRLLDESAFPGFPSGLVSRPPQTFLDSCAALGLDWEG